MINAVLIFFKNYDKWIYGLEEKKKNRLKFKNGELKRSKDYYIFQF